MDNISKIIYINLDKRTDRKELIENDFKKLNISSEKIIRFSAIEHSYPPVGCASSHAAVLKLAHSLNLENVLIFEDDFTFIDDLNRVESDLKKFFNNIKDWDALLFTTSYEKEQINDYLSISKHTGNASGYLVNKHLFLPLSNLIEEAAKKLEETRMDWLYVNDVVWNQFIKGGKWYCFNTRLGYQRAGFSDLSGCMRDHSGL